jgi:hypothetical protein
VNRAILVVLVAIVSACAHSMGTMGTISPVDLKTTVYRIAADSMRGRYPGQPGNIETTEYVAGEFRRLKLTPAGDSGGYFQFVPFLSTTIDTTTTLTIGGQPVALWHDVVPINSTPNAARFDAGGVSVVYGGQLGDTTSAVPASAFTGKLVVYTLALRPDGSPDTRSTRFLPRAQLALAAAIAIVFPDGPPRSLADSYKQRRFALPAAATATPFPMLLVIGPATADALLGKLVRRVRPGTVATPALGGAIRFVGPDTVWARNVVAVLPGADPARRGEYVAMGAHNDHVGVAPRAVDHDSLRAYNILLHRAHLDGPAAGNGSSAMPGIVVNVDSLRRIGPVRRDSIFNGADDDGAGTASLLAIAQAFATDPHKPARSILFVSHAGEEQGLLGSKWYSEHSTVPRDSIVTYLNMDLLGHGDSVDVDGGGPRYLQSGGARRLSHELGALIDTVNAHLAEPMAIDYSWDAPGHPSQKYCRSDHQSYARFGVPVAYFSTGYSVDYHQVTDEPQYLDYPHMARVARLVYAVARAVADLDHRPVIDQPKPDPTAPCRQ